MRLTREERTPIAIKGVVASSSEVRRKLKGENVNDAEGMGGNIIHAS